MTHQIYSNLGRRLEKNLRDGPVGPFVDELATTILDQGYKKRYLRSRFTVVRALSLWLVHECIELRRLDSKRVNEFIRYRSSQSAFMGESGELVTLNTLIDIMRNNGAVPIEEKPLVPIDRIDEALSDYKTYLTEEKGLVPTTILRYLTQIRKFLSHIFDVQALDFSSISAQAIMGFIQDHASGHSAADSAMMVCAIRSFLRFLVIQGQIDASLAECVPTVCGAKDRRIPSHLTRAELSHLLKCNKGTTPELRRNYAILLLLARLGLRASEVAALSIDDIDWNHGELTIQGKGDRQACLPLPKDVGNALVGYLKRVRPTCSYRNVFITLRAPYRPFKNGTAVSAMVNHAVKRAGLNPQNKGAHLLRHTLATECLRKGATLTEIGEILRHRSIDTTAIYAKVDFTRLATLRMPWPNRGEQ